jgi:hypothetical protein
MTIDLWVVTYEGVNCGIPSIFETAEKAYEVMRITLIDYGERYCFESEDVDIALKDMANEFDDRLDNDYFGGQIGECGVYAYKRSLNI